MKISESWQYPGTDVDSVYALITDKAHREAAADDQGALSREVTVEGGTVTIIREMEADMPDFIKKLTGPTAKIKQTENWVDDGNGGKKADIKMSIIGQPAEMTGTATLIPDADGAKFSVDGDFKVSIPFIGKKIEPEVGKAINKSLAEEVAFTVSKL